MCLFKVIIIKTAKRNIFNCVYSFAKKKNCLKSTEIKINKGNKGNIIKHILTLFIVFVMCATELLFWLFYNRRIYRIVKRKSTRFVILNLCFYYFLKYKQPRMFVNAFHRTVIISNK